MRADLHVHSNASDGTDPPAEVMRRAARAGLDVVALTDHDTVAGHAQARRALPAPLILVPGMELSCRLNADDREVPGGSSPVASPAGGCLGGRPPVASPAGGCLGGRPPVASTACTCWPTCSTPATRSWPRKPGASATIGSCGPAPWWIG